MIDGDLRALLQECFAEQPAFRERDWWNEEPEYRCVQHDQQGIVAHVGAITRLVGVGPMDLLVLGICEVATTERARHQGLAKAGLAAAHAWGESQGCDYAILFTDSPRLYYSSGYIDFPKLEWGMMRGLKWATNTWPDGEIDLNGPVW